MSIIGTCGHEVSGTGPDGMGYPIISRDYDRMGLRAAAYSVVCKSCRDWHESEGLLIKDNEAALSWMDEDNLTGRESIPRCDPPAAHSAATSKETDIPPPDLEKK